LTEIAELNQDAVAINELERRLLNLETSYLASVTRMEQAKTLQGLETANISSVNSLQDASYDAVPAGMSRLKKLLLGLMLAMASSLGIVALSEYFNRSFVTSSQVENALDIPVLVSISEGRHRFIEVGYQDG
jgi:capsular polysaccharide biosynthesis protein